MNAARPDGSAGHGDIYFLMGQSLLFAAFGQTLEGFVDFLFQEGFNFVATFAEKRFFIGRNL